MMRQNSPSEEELMNLSKKQLVNFILQKLSKKEETGPAINVLEPPGFKLPPKLPPKPIIFNQSDYSPLKLKPPSKLPPVPDKATGERKKKAMSPDEVSGTKKIFVKCERCDQTLIIDLPRCLVLCNPLEVVPVTILHAKDHALTVYLDQNFESRRDYISELFILDENEGMRSVKETKD
ncbi:MAG: hypothetical protein ACTSVI_14315 [Promethearchaeota archaeon]